MENTRVTAPFLPTQAAREAAVPTLILLSLSLLGGCSRDAQLDPTEADAARDRAAARAQGGD